MLTKRTSGEGLIGRSNSSRVVPVKSGTLSRSRPAGSGFPDCAALGLGRYLRAARLNAGWSYEALAGEAGLVRVTVIALESGLLPPADIRAEWLDRLAAALNEDAGDLRLLLNLPVARPERAARAAAAAESRLLRLTVDDADDDHPAGSEAHPPYHGAGWIDCRARYRSIRPQRDPERLYFDK